MTRESTMLHFIQQQFPFTNQPWNELSALITCSYTLMPPRNTLSSRNCNIEINIDFEHHILDKESGSRLVSVTSLLSCSSIGVFDIGENPRAGMPSCLTKRESVVEDKISGLDSFPPAEVIAFSNMDHHGFDSFVAVNMGRPATSVTGPFCISCMNDKGFQELQNSV